MDGVQDTEFFAEGGPEPKGRGKGKERAKGNTEARKEKAKVRKTPEDSGLCGPGGLYRSVVGRKKQKVSQN